MLVVQDNDFEGSLHLDEVILSLVPSSVCGGAAFAFVTADGLNAVFGSGEFKEYFKKYSFELIIGIDAITNIAAITRASELIREYRGNFHVRVYFSEDNSSIFHPKFVWFEEKAGSGPSLIIGSGNLTASGLQRNTEAFCWIEGNVASDEVVDTWNQWISSCESKGLLYEINDPKILDLAMQNTRIYQRRSGIQGQPSFAPNGEPDPNIDLVPSVEKDLEIMIAGIPMQRGRESQFNMPKKFFTDFFGFDANDAEKNASRRVLLQQIDVDGKVHDMESRAGVISSTSSNYRIELDGTRGLNREGEGFPCVVILRIGNRRYLYCVLSQSDDLYDEVLEFAKYNNQASSARQLPKCIVPAFYFAKAIPSLPISSYISSEGILDDFE